MKKNSVLSDPNVRQRTGRESYCLDINGQIWDDATSYSRLDEDRIPTLFRLNVKSVVITITVNHANAPGQWVYLCPGLSIGPTVCRDTYTATSAARYALEACQRRAHRIFKDLTRKV